MLDGVTLEAYRVASTATAMGQAVADSLGSGTLHADVYSGASVVYTGSFAGPLSASGGTVFASVRLTGAYSGTGTPSASTWKLRIRNEAGTRWVDGTFGPGGRFTLSAAAFANGQAVRLGISIAPFTEGEEPEGLAFVIPSTLTIDQGGTLDLSQYATGGAEPYILFELETGTLQTGVTYDDETGILSAAVDATVETQTGLSFAVTDSEAVAVLPDFTVTSAVGGSDLPFTFGHVFAQGDVPTGSYVDSDLTDWQAVPTTYWPDGSVRHAIISGRATCTASVAKVVTLSVSGTNRSGTALTTTDLASALPTTTLVCGTSAASLTGETITLGALIGGTPHRTVCEGPVMSNWIWREPVGNSAHLVAWFDVRLYKGGAVEVFPWIENAYLLVASPTNDVRDYVFTMGGTERFNQSALDIKHHTRVPLVSGSTFSHWSSDPEIIPTHDVAYLQATKAVPNFGWDSPSETTLNNLTQTYTPNTVAGMSVFTAGGGSAGILGHTSNKADAFYASTGDARAYRGAIVLGLSSGSWSVHYRDESTQEPFAFSTYPLMSLQIQNTPTVPSGTGGVNGSYLPNPGTSHQPPFAYLGWLVTGRWFFLDEIKYWATNNYLWQSYATRESADGLILPNAGANTDRGSAWGIRTLAQLLFSLPTALPSPREPDALFAADLLNSLEKNISWYYESVISGTRHSGAYINNLGLFPSYGAKGTSVYTVENGYQSDAGAMWNTVGWMQMMIVLMWGYVWDLDLSVSTGAKSQHLAVRNHGYKLPVGVSGAGDPDAWNYRWFGSYDLVAGLKTGATWFPDWNTAYDTAVGELGSPPSDNLLIRPYGTSTTNQWGPAPDVYLTSFFGQHHVALAYAVEHDMTGAAAAWSRVIGTTNYVQYTNGFSNEPVYGIVPRSA